MRIFLTGVAGFIGSTAAETLLGRGDEVFGIDSFDPFYDLLVEQQNATDTLQEKIDAMQNSLNTMTYIAVAALVVAVMLGAVAIYLPRKRK